MQVRRVSIHGGWVGEPHAPTGRGTATARESRARHRHRAGEYWCAVGSDWSAHHLGESRRFSVN
jgi:hypothetical protein